MPSGRAEEKTGEPGTQGNATNAVNFTSSPGNNNKSNGNRAVPFYDCAKSGLGLESRVLSFGLVAARPRQWTDYRMMMREHVTIEDINDAWLDCRRRKGSTDGCAEYGKDALLNNLRLWRELNTQAYEIGPSKAFCVTRPKVREVFCAEFRDRVVHHLAVNKFLPLFEGMMSDDAYACRKGKGTLYGARRVRAHIERVSHGYTREAWILKGDLRGFFMSIDRRTLCGMVEDIIRRGYGGGDAEWWLWLWRKLIMHAPEENCRRVGDLSLWAKLPANKSLFTNGEGKGLPIGNLPSQVLANLLLTPFDRWAEERLGEEGGYGRYVDDFVWVHPDKGLLLGLYRDARAFLRERLGLALHPGKFYLQEARKGVTFAGATIKPGRTYPSRRTSGGLFEAIGRRNRREVPLEGFVNTYNSYTGQMRHHDTYGMRWRAWKAIADKSRLCCVNMNYLKTINKRKEKTIWQHSQ